MWGILTGISHGFAYLCKTLWKETDEQRWDHKGIVFDHMSKLLCRQKMITHNIHNTFYISWSVQLQIFINKQSITFIISLRQQHSITLMLTNPYHGLWMRLTDIVLTETIIIKSIYMKKTKKTMFTYQYNLMSPYSGFPKLTYRGAL